MHVDQGAPGPPRPSVAGTTVTVGPAYPPRAATTGTVPDVLWRGRVVSVVAAALLAAAALAGCGSGDSTVAKTPPPTSAQLPPPPADPPAAAEPEPTSAAPPDPCAVDLAAPAIAEAVSRLPQDPRSRQPWNPEPLAGNYNTCAQLSTVIVAANTNAANPNTRAVMFHRGEFVAEGVPDTFGFNGIDLAQCTDDTVALTYATGIAGLTSVVKFRWNGAGVDLISNSTG